MGFPPNLFQGPPGEVYPQPRISFVPLPERPHPSRAGEQIELREFVRNQQDYQERREEEAKQVEIAMDILAGEDEEYEVGKEVGGLGGGLMDED